MTQILRMSALYAPTLKEDPSDADIDSARLLLRAGMLRKAASGLYTFLPLGFRVLKKIENIVREEMDASGAQEILMPVLQPAELWEESGRLNDYGPELMRLVDRHDREMCLGPTHEEIIVALVRNELRSYKELPQNLYQIQTKYRDEIRPRFGLLRSREFVMKDAYSFNATQESLQETYDAMGKAYGAICDRCGLDYREVEADGGQIGGKVTTEFMALADSGRFGVLLLQLCGRRRGRRLPGPTHGARGGRHGEDCHARRAHHRRAGGVLEHPRVFHGEGPVWQGCRGKPRVRVHPGRPRAERAED